MKSSTTHHETSRTWETPSHPKIIVGHQVVLVAYYYFDFKDVSKCATDVRGSFTARLRLVYVPSLPTQLRLLAVAGMFLHQKNYSLNSFPHVPPNRHHQPRRCKNRSVSRFSVTSLPGPRSEQSAPTTLPMNDRLVIHSTNYAA